MPHGPRPSYLPEFKGSKTLYRMLDAAKHEIRVLTLWPNEDFWAPLECTLQIRTIVEARCGYVAISYYWGSANDLEYVLVHGSDEGAPTPSCEVPVTRNLASALREFRKRAVNIGEPLVMWTDALCIDQRNVVERDFQVRIMRNIFQGSRRIYVWLGDHSSCNTAAKNGLESLVAMSDRLDVHAFKRSQSPDGKTRLIPHQAWEASELLESINALMDSPYWRRGWVLQEVCFSEVPVHLFFGDQECEIVDWTSFFKTVVGITDFEQDRTVQLTEAQWRNVAVYAPFLYASALHDEHRLEMLCSYYSIFHQSQDPISILNQGLKIMVVEKTWSTTDPRDAVFVLRGLLPAFRQLRTGYDDTVEDVFSEATTKLLRHGATWSQLLWSQPSRSPYLPSWVVDFSTSSLNETEYLHKVEMTLWLNRSFDASASSSTRIDAVTPRTLSTAAFIFDEIEDISHCSTHLDRSSTFNPGWWRQWFRLVLKACTKQNPIAISRTICANTAPGGPGPSGRKCFTSNDVDLFGEHYIGRLLGMPRAPDRKKSLRLTTE